MGRELKCPGKSSKLGKLSDQVICVCNHRCNSSISTCTTLLRSQRKDEVMKENASQVWKERKQRRKSEAAQRFMKTAEADKAYNTWLAKKDLETRDKTRAVMISDTPRPTWCPARTLHSVPSHRLSRIQTSRKKSLSSLRAQHSYSLDSFAGSESVSSATSEGGSEAELSRASSSGQDNAAHSTGTLKTVQVCCKTLKYWCNCD